MEFFDKLGKKASEAYKVTADKTGKIAKEAKLKMKMNELKSEINDIYKDIGKVVYENHIREEKTDIANELEEKCTKIDCLSDEIESYLKECLQLKDKKKCPNCFAEIEKNVKFCPECGAKQEVNVEEPAKEVEIVDEKCDNQENKQQDNNEENSNNNGSQQNDNNIKDNNENNTNNEEKTNLEKTIEIESDVDLNNSETVEHFEVEDEEDD